MMREDNVGGEGVVTTTLQVQPGLMRGRVVSEDDALVRSDPIGRCFLAFAKQSSKLFVVPFSTSRVCNAYSDPKEMLKTEQTFWIDLEEFGIRNVKDIVFCEGTFEPTIVVIYEPIQTWSGRVAIHANTVFAASFTIDTFKRSSKKIWTVSSLPYDAFLCLAVPEVGGGGVVLVCASSILQIRNGVVTSGLYTNSCGESLIKLMEDAEALSTGPISKAGCIADLETAKACLLRDSGPECSVVLSLKGGELYLLTLPPPSSRGGMQMIRGSSSVPAAQVVAFRDNFFVLASRLSVSVLVEYKSKRETLQNGESHPVVCGEDEDMQEVFDENETEEPQQTVTSWSLKKRDALPMMGPAADMCIGRNERAEAEEEEPVPEGEQKTPKFFEELEVVTGGGMGSSGGVTILERSLRAEYVTKRDAIQLQGYRSAWTLGDPFARKVARKARERRNTSSRTRNERIRKTNEQLLASKESWKIAQKAEREKLLRDQMQQRKVEREEKEMSEEDKRKEEEEDETVLVDAIENMKRDIDRAAEEQFALQVEEPLEETPVDEDELNSYLLLSANDSTVVLETGLEITELVEVDFRVDCPTLTVGNVLGGRASVQVHKEGARLLKGRRLILDHALPYDSGIVGAQVLDPYILLRLENGLVAVVKVEADEEAAQAESQGKDITSALAFGESLMDEYGGGLNGLDELEEDESIPNVKVTQVFVTDVHMHGFVTAACLYYGPFEKSRFADSPVSSTTGNEDVASMEEDEEEYLLYGKIEDQVPMSVDMEEAGKRDSLEEAGLLLVANREGELEIFETETFELIVRCRRFYLGPTTLADEGEAAGAVTPDADLRQDGGAPRVVNLTMAPVGPNGHGFRKVPVLAAVFQHGQVMVYLGFSVPEECTKGELSGRSRMRFRKIVCDDVVEQRGESIRLVSFRNVGERAGIFVTGKRPFFIFADRGYPRLHPLRIRPDSEVTDFAEIHNVICPHGFVTVELDGTVRIGALPGLDDVVLDSLWPLRRINLRCTVSHFAYHAQTSTYGILASHYVPQARDSVRKSIKEFSSQVQLEKEKGEAQGLTVSGVEEDSADASALGTKDPRKFTGSLPTLMQEKHELRLYRPDTWELLKTHSLKDFEVGLAVTSTVIDVYKVSKPAKESPRAQQQKGEAAPSLFATSVKLRPKHMLVVGTGYLKGEDSSSRGRLLMFEVSKQERFVGDQKVSTFQMQLIAERELKGQVSAVQALQGYVVVGVGPKVEVYKLVEDEIVCCSFFFAQLFCTSITSLKQYVIVGDMFKSISFLYWRDRNKSLNFLGKDYQPLQTYATEFLLHNDDLSLVASDGLGNIQLFNYENATVAESRGGTRLLANGGFHLGSRINKFQRVRAYGNMAEDSKGASQQLTMYSTLNSGLGALVPVSEKTFQLLSALQAKLAQSPDLPHLGGLNPREFRKFRPERTSHQLLNQRLLDGHLLLEFHSLDAVRKKEMARQIGSNLKEIMSTFQSLDTALTRF
mmetsp:Transcript_27297/g.106676  ORF Transcript_27297/g.106676 Transcript_27297/m.106676 type:complete len:1491 (+) Transcript_27297:112-4584(+)